MSKRVATRRKCLSGGLSTKINAVVDESGLPVRFMLTAGQAHDFNAAPHLLAGLNCRHVVADRGYDADALLALIRGSGAKGAYPIDAKPPDPAQRQPTHLPTAQSDGVILAPFFPPAACWWARMMELSIKAIDFGDFAARASKTRTHTPARRADRAMVSRS